MNVSTKLREAGIVPPPTGYRPRPTGAGKHAQGVRRQRTRAASKAAAITEQRSTA